MKMELDRVALMWVNTDPMGEFGSLLRQIDAKCRLDHRKRVTGPLQIRAFDAIR